MLETLVPPQAPVETQKPKEGRPAYKSPKEGPAASSSAFAYAREDLEIRYESKDGDVLEVRRSLTVAAGYTRNACGSPAGCGGKAEPAWLPFAGGAEDAEDAGAADAPGKGGLAGARKWAREVAHEIEKQHARLLETLLRGGDAGAGEGAEGGRFVMFSFVLRTGGEAEGEAGAMDEEYGVPEHWNAENTSDRIVAFATSFAGIFGDDPAFAETMVEAVAEGFRQAGDILGNLPGKAGKLNRDTQDLVFEKLDVWLEAWKSGAYNQGAQPEPLEPALSA